MDYLQRRNITRRQLLTLAGASVAGVVAAPVFGQAGGALACVATPEQTEGPYFVDERLLRSDIRGDPADGSVREGWPLALTIRVASIGKDGCKPLAGALVDLWHCDAQGAYSDTADPHFNTKGKKFLRGYQVTDAAGRVQITTIYPGWYPGRAVHIHFKVRADPKAGAARELTSQFYFDDAFTDRVHARGPYAKRGSGRLKNAGDFLFRDGGSRLILPVAETAQGYAGSFEVAIRLG
jgi:protocatechuate 3,4-dioxygenase beta subunit